MTEAFIAADILESVESWEELCEAGIRGAEELEGLPLADATLCSE
jgi:hypothetical protein